MRAGVVILGLVALPGLCHAQLVNVGAKGNVNAATMGCPNESDISDYLSALVKATNANDSVGKIDAYESAVGAGCKSFIPSDSGLVIDRGSQTIPGFNFNQAYLRIRMDVDEVAYWLPADDISPGS